MVLFRSDYNEAMIALSTLLGRNIVRQGFFSVTGGAGRIFDGTRAKKVECYTETKDNEVITYEEYDNGSIATYKLTTDNGTQKATIETSDVKLGAEVFPRMTITLEDKDSEVEFVQLDVSSFSMSASIKKRVNDSLLTRSITYQDCNYQTGYVSFDHPARLKRFSSQEEIKSYSNTTTRALSIEQIYPVPIITYTDFSNYNLPDKRIAAIELDDLNDVIKGLLSNERSINLFDYVFDRLEDRMPGVLDYFHERLPFFTDTTDMIFAHDETKLTSFIKEAYGSLANKDLDLPNEKQKQKELTN